MQLELEQSDVTRISWVIEKASKNFGIIETDGAYKDDIIMLRDAGLVKRVRPGLYRYKLTLKGWKLARRLAERVPDGA